MEILPDPPFCYFLFLQANVNPKAELANDFEGKRKAVHIGSCKLMRDDLKEKAAIKEAAIKVILLFPLYYQYFGLTPRWFRLEWMRIAMERLLHKVTVTALQ